MLTHRANAPGTLLGAALGFLVTVFAPLSGTLVRILVDHGVSPPAGFTVWIENMNKISNFYYGAMGTLATLIAGYATGLLFPRPDVEKIRGLTRRHPPIGEPT